MALVGISTFEDEEYVSVLDPCRIVYPDDHPDPALRGKINIQASREKGATIFMIGALTVNQRTFITDKTGVVQESDNEGGTRLVHRTGSRNAEAVRFGLRGWENFKDPKENDIPLTRIERIVVGHAYKAVDDETLARLGMALITELGETILERNNFVDSIAKNLSGLVPPSPSSRDTNAEGASPTSENKEGASAPLS